MLGFVSTLGEADDVASLRDRTMAGLRGLLRPDGVGYTEIDLVSGEAGMWSDPPEVAERADTEAFVELLHQHPIAAYHERNGGRHAVQLSDFLSRRELHGLDLYNEFYRPLEVEHQLAISVDAPGPLSIPISVHRGNGAFSERDRAVLTLLHPHLQDAHRRLAAKLSAARVLEALGEAHGTALVALSRDDRIELVTGRAREWLGKYFGESWDGADALPPRLSSWIDAVGARGQEARALDASAECLTVRRPGTQLSIRYLPGGSWWEHDILLLEERRARPDPEELRQRGLTPRETEVLLCAADGRTDGEIAQELSISPRTVQKHLQSTYRKLGVITRTAALARALDRPPDGV